MPLLFAGACSTRADTYRRLRAEAASTEPKFTGDAPNASAARDDNSFRPFQRASELTRDELVTEVLARNPSLAAMHGAWQAAIARYPQVTAYDDPQFGYLLAPESIGSDDVQFAQKFELSQRIPWPGKLGLKGDAALDRAQAAGYDFEETRLRLIEAAENAFYEYYFVHRAIEINRVNQGLLLELSHIAERRYGAGLVPKQDVLQADVEHHHLQHRGIVLSRIRSVTTARINTLLNVAPDRELPPPPLKLDGVQPPPARDALNRFALERRPELAALEMRVRALEADVALAKREYFPDLAVSGAYNSLWRVDELRPVVGLGFNVPLQLARRDAALAEAEAEQYRAVSELREVRARVLFAVSTAADELAESVHVVHLYKTSIIPAADESLAAALSGYETNRNDFLTLIAAQKTFMLAKLSYEEALAEYHQSRARLESAIGGSINAAEERP